MVPPFFRAKTYRHMAVGHKAGRASARPAMKKKVDPYDIDAFLSHENAAAPSDRAATRPGPTKRVQADKENNQTSEVVDLEEEEVVARAGRPGGQAVAKEATTSYGLRSPAPVVVLDEDDEDEGGPQQGLFSDIDSLFGKDEPSPLPSPAPRGGASPPKPTKPSPAAEKKKRKRRVTFSEKSELKFYSPDKKTKEEREKTADAIEWGDEVEFALDGLRCAKSAGVCLRSAHQLVVLCSSPSHRGYLEDDPEARDGLLEGSAKLAAMAASGVPAPKDSDRWHLSLCSSLVLHNLVNGATWRLDSSHEADPVLAVTHALLGLGAASLRAALSAGGEGLPEPVKCYAKMKSVSKALTLDRSFPESCHESLLPLMVALLVLGRKVRSPETARDSGEYEMVKDRLAGSGVLSDLIGIVVSCDLSGGAGATDLSAGKLGVQRNWILTHALKVLAGATFLNEKNVGLILEASAGEGDGESVPAFLLRMAECQYRSADAGLRECLGPTLNVLVNLTEDSRACCEALRSSTDFCGLARMVADYHYSRGQDRSLEDLVNLVLGILINLSEKDLGTRQKLRALPMASFCDHEDSQIRGLGKTFVDFVFVAANLGDQAQGQDTEAQGEVTLEMLNSSGGGGQKSICQTYCAILLAFLVAGDKALQKSTARLLPGCTLKPLIAKVRNFLDFLTSMSALTEKQKDVLTDLCAALT